MTKFQLHLAGSCFVLIKTLYLHRNARFRLVKQRNKSLTESLSLPHVLRSPLFSSGKKQCKNQSPICSSSTLDQPHEYMAERSYFSTHLTLRALAAPTLCSGGKSQSLAISFCGTATPGKPVQPIQPRTLQSVSH